MEAAGARTSPPGLEPAAMTENTQRQVREKGFVLVDCGIPDGMTIAEYRAARDTPESPRKRRLGLRRRRRV